MNLLRIQSDWESLQKAIGRSAHTNVYCYMRNSSDIVTNRLTQVDTIPSFPCFAIVQYTENKTVLVYFVTIEDAEELLHVAQHMCAIPIDYDSNTPLIDTTE